MSKKSVFSKPDILSISPLLCLLPDFKENITPTNYTTTFFARLESVAARKSEYKDNDPEQFKKLLFEQEMLNEILILLNFYE